MGETSPAVHAPDPYREFEQLKRYLGFGPAESETLRETLPRIRESFDAIIEDFYARILEHEATRRVISGPDQIARLKQTLLAWLEELFSGSYDRAHFDKRMRIGFTHVRVGLPQEYVFGAMAHIRDRLGRLIRRIPSQDAAALDRRISALDKAVLLDLSVIAGSYSMAERVRDLKAERDFIAAVLDTAGALVIVLDRRGRVVRFNRACERLSGRSAADVLGRPFWDLGILPDEHVEPVRRVFSELAAGRFPNRNTNPWRCREGRLRLIEWTNTALVDAEGRVEYVIGTGIDVSKREHLARQLLERESLARLGQMAAVVAHEVKNPMAAISAAVQVLQERFASSSPEHQVMGEIRARILGLNLIVQDLLEFARPRTPNLAPVAIRPLLRETADLVVHEPAYREIRVEIEGAEATLRADADLLRPVFLNVFLNAAQAMGGRGTVRVSVEPVDGTCRIRVRDTGPGVPPEVLAQAFEPFFTTKSRGSGLGLPIARQMVRLHGGEVLLSSAPEGGAVVTIDLPVGEPAP